MRVRVLRNSTFDPLTTTYLVILEHGRYVFYRGLNTPSLHALVTPRTMTRSPRNVPARTAAVNPRNSWQVASSYASLKGDRPLLHGKSSCSGARSVFVRLRRQAIPKNKRLSARAVSRVAKWRADLNSTRGGVPPCHLEARSTRPTKAYLSQNPRNT